MVADALQNISSFTIGYKNNRTDLLDKIKVFLRQP